jgi:membrane fusion protein (multidrug efflux system)
LLVGALALIAGGIAGWRYLSSYESTDDAQVDAHLHPVSARISGHVIRVSVGDNEYVKQGTVLVEIDPTDIRSLSTRREPIRHGRSDRRIAAHRRAHHQHDDLEPAGFDGRGRREEPGCVVAAEKQLAAANAQVDQAQANDVKAQHDLRRCRSPTKKRWP